MLHSKKVLTPIHASLLGVAVWAAAMVGAVGAGQAQDRTLEVVYGSNIDPNNKTDPRATAQARIIEEFEKDNPAIKVKVLVDPTQASYLRALKSKSVSPDVINVIGYAAPEFAATGSLAPLEEFVQRDKIDEKDWLIPLADVKVNDKLYGLPLDFRVPLLLYRKSALAQAGLKPPRTWTEVCEGAP